MKPDGYCLKGPDGKLVLHSVAEDGAEVQRLSGNILCWLRDVVLHPSMTTWESVKAAGYTVVPVRVVEVKE